MVGAVDVKRQLRLWAGIRIGYGVVAILAPDVMAEALRLKPHPDARGFNAFLGSRDIVIGLYALRASDPRQVGDAILLNQACEAIDTVVLVREVQAGRGADLFTVAGFAFNALGTATWVRARRAARASAA